MQKMIPKVLHQIWISHPLAPVTTIPQRYVGFIQAWQDLHPQWETHLWGNELFEKYKEHEELDRMLRDPRIDESKMTNLLRFLLLRDFGGLYADIDVEPFRNFDKLTELPTTAVLGILERCDRGYTFIDPSVCLFDKDHPVLTKIVDEFYSLTYAPRGGILMNWLTDEIDETYTILGYKSFFAHQRYPESYCLHWPHRLASWKKPNH